MASRRVENNDNTQHGRTDRQTVADSRGGDSRQWNQRRCETGRAATPPLPERPTQKVERVMGPAGERGSISRGQRSWKSVEEAQSAACQQTRSETLLTSVPDYGVGAANPALLLLALKLQFVGSFAPGDALRDVLWDRLRLPASATGGFADLASTPERVRVELAEGELRINDKHTAGLRDGSVRPQRRCRDTGGSVGTTDSRAGSNGVDGSTLRRSVHRGRYGGRTGARLRVADERNGAGLGHHRRAGSLVAMDLVVAVVANTTFEDGGDRGIVDLNRHVPGRMEE